MATWQSGYAVGVSGSGKGAAHLLRIEAGSKTTQVTCRRSPTLLKGVHVGKIGTKIGASRRLLLVEGKVCNVCAETAVRVTR